VQQRDYVAVEGLLDERDRLLAEAEARAGRPADVNRGGGGPAVP
jgi:hypothetical protein